LKTIIYYFVKHIKYINTKFKNCFSEKEIPTATIFQVTIGSVALAELGSARLKLSAPSPSALHRLVGQTLVAFGRTTIRVLHSALLDRLSTNRDASRGTEVAGLQAVPNRGTA
jgi:hypothetical protein